MVGAYGDAARYPVADESTARSPALGCGPGGARAPRDRGRRAGPEGIAELLPWLGADRSRWAAPRLPRAARPRGPPGWLVARLGSGGRAGRERGLPARYRGLVRRAC